MAYRGEVAQLGERRVRNAEVGSSILLFSTTLMTVRALQALHLRRVPGKQQTRGVTKWLPIRELQHRVPMTRACCATASPIS